MRVSDLIREIEQAGYRIVTDGSDIIVGDAGQRLPDEYAEQLRVHKPQVLTWLIYRQLVKKARALAHRIDDEGRCEEIADYERVVNNLVATERVLANWGFTAEETAELVRAVFPGTDG